jgi:hypothetical protein
VAKPYLCLPPHHVAAPFGHVEAHGGDVEEVRVWVEAHEVWVENNPPPERPPPLGAGGRRVERPADWRRFVLPAGAPTER